MIAPHPYIMFNNLQTESTVCGISGNSVVLNLYFDLPHIRKSLSIWAKSSESSHRVESIKLDSLQDLFIELVAF